MVSVIQLILLIDAKTEAWMPGGNNVKEM
uniref:Uncharacterized protein n=1 Tax=Arundo donax TaxID=35708 RepID=A0A0A9AYV3_ARUDO